MVLSKSVFYCKTNSVSNFALFDFLFKFFSVPLMT